MVAMFWNNLIERRKSRVGSQSILLYPVLGWSLGSTLSLLWRRHTSLFLYIYKFLYWLNIHQAQHRMEQNQYRIKWYTSEQFPRMYLILKRPGTTSRTDFKLHGVMIVYGTRNKTWKFQLHRCYRNPAAINLSQTDFCRFLDLGTFQRDKRCSIGLVHGEGYPRT